MTETVHEDYEVSSEGCVRHWEIPYARLHDQTPTPTNAARVTGRVAATQLSGTILTVDVVRSFAIIDFTCSAVYKHDVRTVTTYAGGATGAENGWQTLNIGDPVYYDDSSTMPAGVYLSTAPANNNPLGTGNSNNNLFGWIVPAPSTTGFDTDAAEYPKAAGNAGNTWRCAIMQRGAGG
jgi:hypothetical protein